MKVILETRIREEAIDEAKAFLQKVIPDTRIYNGCLNSKLLQDEKRAYVFIDGRGLGIAGAPQEIS